MISNWDPRVTSNGTEKAQRVTRYSLGDPDGFYKILSGLAFIRDHFKEVGDAFGKEQMQVLQSLMRFHCNGKCIFVKRQR